MKSFYKIIILCYIFITILYSKEIRLEQLQKYPRSVSRDFYIWQFLQQNISPFQAQKSLELIYNMNNKLFFAYAKKINNDEILSVAQCMQAKAYDLINQNDDCIMNGLTIQKATQLDRSELDTIIQKIKSQYPIEAKKYQVLVSSIPFTQLMMSDNKTFFSVFNNCGSQYRRRYFNYKFSKRKLKKLSMGDFDDFNQMLQTIVIDPNLTNIQASILDINSSSLTLETKFFLGLNYLRYKKDSKALKLFKEIYNKSTSELEKDKVTFWQYLVTKDVGFLEILANSNDINIYSLYALEIMGISANVVTNIDINTTKISKFDISDPLQWSRVLEALQEHNRTKIDYYTKLFDAKNTVAQFVFIKNNINKKNYFLRPYDNYMKNLTKDRKAIINAIARQESFFIPSAISSSYAQGVMQLMPFLSKDIAQKLKDRYDIFNMFDYKINLRYANRHLNYLINSLEHPLFVAYAYNGGIGFTNRVLNSGYFGVGQYEPFISIETIPNKQTREYGKKVLANSVIYRQLYGLPTSLIRVIKTAISLNNQF